MSGAELARLRIAEGWTQAKAAKHLGVKRQATISEWEGRTVLEGHAALALAYLRLRAELRLSATAR